MNTNNLSDNTRVIYICKTCSDDILIKDNNSTSLGLHVAVRWLHSLTPQYDITDFDEYDSNF
jgi:hypothetical protein